MQTWYDPSTNNSGSLPNPITYIPVPTSYTQISTVNTSSTMIPTFTSMPRGTSYWQVSSFGLSRQTLDQILTELHGHVTDIYVKYSTRINMHITDLDIIAIRKMLKKLEFYKVTPPEFGIKTEQGRKRVYLIIHNLFDSGVSDYVVDVTQNLVTEFDALDDGINKFNFEKVYKSFASLCKYLKKEGYESWRLSLTDLEKSLSPYKVIKSGKTDLSKKEIHLDCQQGMLFMDEPTYKFLSNQAKWDGFKTNLAALLASDDGEIAEAAFKIAVKLFS